jgi:hypothetical protein
MQGERSIASERMHEGRAGEERRGEYRSYVKVYVHDRFGGK